MSLSTRSTHTILGIISFLIVGLMYSPSSENSLFAVPPDPRWYSSDDCETQVIEPPSPSANTYTTCCWTDYTETNPETGELIFDRYCQICYIKEDQSRNCFDPQKELRSQLGGTHGPVTDGVVEPLNPPSLKDDAMNPLTGGGIENPTTTPQTPPTDQNVAPGGGIVEQGKEIPSSKGTKSPLDTILGFNGPPATSESDNSGLPATGGNELPTANEDGTSEYEPTANSEQQGSTGTGSEVSKENLTNEDETNQAPSTAEPVLVDSDNDSVPDGQDNCPEVANEDQLDSNNNGIGDVCDQGQEEEQQPTADTSDNQDGEDQGQIDGQDQQEQQESDN